MAGDGATPHRGDLRPTSRKWLAIAAAVLVVTAGVGYVAYRSFASPTAAGHGSGASTSPVNPGNGLTFLQAFGPVNESVQGTSGSPWTPTSIVGIAPQAPAAPLPNYRLSLNETLRLCQELPGVTVWNSSGIPVFNGTLNSGAAPFWSFIFKNATGAYMYATNLEGKVTVDPPSTTFEACLMAGGLGSSYLLNPTENTPAASELAYSTYGENFSSQHSPLVEYYVLGNAQLLDPDASPLGWIVNYFRCDQVGVSGIQDYLAVGNLDNGNESGVVEDNGWLTCTYSDYDLAFESPSNATPSGTAGRYISIPFQVTFPPSGNQTTYYDGWGLLSWMTDLTLTDSEGQQLLPTAATCAAWVPELADCPASDQGWFAVLLSENGAWLDSYPATPGSGSWTIPNVIVSSTDQLVIVTPNSWNASEDALSLYGTPNAPAVIGNTDL